MNKSFIQQLLKNYTPGFSLEQAFYTNTDVFETEWQHIFRKHWLYAGNLAQIQKPGDYFLYRLQNDTVM